MQCCRSCGADVLWARTVKGKAMPIDAEPTANGNVQIQNDNDGLQATVLAGQKLELARLAGAQLHLSHFVTCEYADQHRTKR
jgi:hypothetical protein